MHNKKTHVSTEKHKLMMLTMLLNVQQFQSLKMC